MKLRINKACDLASISILPPRNTRRSGGGGTSVTAKAGAAAASQQRSQSMSQKSFSQGGGGSFSQGGCGGGALFSQGSSGGGAAFSSQGGGGGGGSFSQIGASGGVAFSQGGGSAGAALSQGGGGRGAEFSQGGGGGGASFSGGGGGGASFSKSRGGGGALLSQSSGGGGTAFSQVGGGGGGSFSQGGGGAGAALSQGGGGRGSEYSQGGGDGGASFSQGGCGGGAAFSQGGSGGGASFSQGGGSASLLHSQSQISQASLDVNLLSLLHPTPTREQDNSSKRMSSFPANSASRMRDESQLQLKKYSGQINEDVERKLQHVASSVHKMGMVLDSVQNDVMQLNRAMKEASLDSGSIQKKFVLVETSLQQILKGQDDIKAVLEGSTKSNPDQMGVLNSQTSKLDEISSSLSVFKPVQEELRQLKGDIFSVLRKEMEGIARKIAALNSRADAMQAPTDLSSTTKRKSMINQKSAESPLVNQRPVADGKQAQLADGKPQKKQTPVTNGMPAKKQKPAANGRPQKKQKPVANGRAKRKQAAEANGKPTMKQVPATKVVQAPKPEEAAIEQVNAHAATDKAPLNVIINLDEDGEECSDGSASCVMLKTVTGLGGELTNGEEAMSEDARDILRRARKRRRREENKASRPTETTVDGPCFNRN